MPMHITFMEPRHGRTDVMYDIAYGEMHFIRKDDPTKKYVLYSV